MFTLEKVRLIGNNLKIEYKPVEVKFDMIGRYLGEFAMTYNPTLHNRPKGKAMKGL